MVTHSSILAWRIPWTEGSGGYSPWDCKDSDMTEVTKHACILDAEYPCRYLKVF